MELKLQNFRVKLAVEPRHQCLPALQMQISAISRDLFITVALYSCPTRDSGADKQTLISNLVDIEQQLCRAGAVSPTVANHQGASSHTSLNARVGACILRGSGGGAPSADEWT